MREGGGGDHISVGMRKPSGEYERPITGRRLFWTNPGNCSHFRKNYVQSWIKKIMVVEYWQLKATSSSKNVLKLLSFQCFSINNLNRTSLLNIFTSG